MHLASDSRVTRLSDDGPVITDEHHKKLVEVSEPENIHMTLCGGMQVTDKMLTRITERKPNSLEDHARVAHEYLTEVTNLKEPEMPTDNMTQDEFDEWEKKRSRWELKYRNTSSFVCGFVDEEPKILLVNARHEVPVDISREFTKYQLANGIREDVASQAVLKRTPHYMVRGSYPTQLTNHIEQSSFFKRIEREYAENIDELPREEDLISDEQLDYELSKAIVLTSMYDEFTGGDIYVDTVVFGEHRRRIEGNVVPFYLDNFSDLEKKHSVLLLHVEFEEGYNASNVSKLKKYLWSFLKGEPPLKVLGMNSNGFLYYRLIFDSDDEEVLDYEKPDPSGVAFMKLGQNVIWTEEIGDAFSLHSGGFKIMVGKPTKQVREYLRERFF